MKVTHTAILSFSIALIAMLTRPAGLAEDPVIKHNEIAVVQAAEPEVGEPKKLLIPSISLNANIVTVGADLDGRMSVPSDNNTISWWKYGPKPGETGSSVLAGHYKLDNGTPGPFYNLKNISIGDNLIIIDEFKKETHFKVIKTSIYKETEFPVSKIYATKGGEYLNLITCTGQFIKEKNDYSHRLVAFTKKIK